MMCSYRETEVTRESYWGSHLGEIKQIKDLADTHIINLIHYVQQYPQFYGPQFLEVFQAEAKLRGLEDKMKERAQIPYQDHRGQWWVWDFEKGYPIVVGREAQEVEPAPPVKKKVEGLASWLPSFFQEFLYGSDE